MTNHVDRYSLGFRIVVWLAALSFVGAVCWVAWTEVIGPHLQAIAMVLGGLIGANIAIYLIGYIASDLPDDVARWMDDE